MTATVLPNRSVMEKQCSLLHFTYFHIHFYLRPLHIKTLLRPKEICCWTCDVLLDLCERYMAWPLRLLLKLLFFSWAEITNYVSWSEADINYPCFTVCELDKKKNDLWNADSEYVAGKLNVKWSKIRCWNSGSQRILDSCNFYLYFRPN